MTSDSTTVERLAREGRVRGDVSGYTIPDVAGKMSETQAAALLHDGAGWDVAQIAAELQVAEAEVRRRVARGRLASTDVPSDPCPNRLDGLMAFSADAVDHAMTCEGCKATREALRDGKIRIRTSWNASDTEPVRPWHVADDTPPATTRPTSAKPVGVAAPAPSVVPARSLATQPSPTRPKRVRPRRRTPIEEESAEQWAERVRRERTATVSEGSPPTATSRPMPRTADGTPIKPISLPNRSPKPEENPPPPPRRRRRFRLPLSTLSALVVAVVVLGTLAATTGPQPEAAVVSTASPSILHDVMVRTVTVWTRDSDPGISDRTWVRLAGCESSGDWTINTGNGFYGGLQFTQDSWELVGGTGQAHEAPRHEQIARATALQEIQGWEAWPACSERLGLR